MVLLGLLACLLPLLGVIIFWWRLPNKLYSYYRLCKLLRLIPSPNTLPKEHWLLGHAPYLYKQDEAVVRKMFDYVNGTSVNGGVRLFKLWLGPVPNIVVAHSEELSRLLKEPKSRLLYKPLLPWLGEGLLIAEGRKWFRNRHLLTPAFHYEILKCYVPVYNNCLSVLLEKWMECSINKEPVVLFDSLSLMSLDVIMQCAFSFKSDCQRAKVQLPYVKACSELVHLCTDRGMNAFMLIDRIFWRTPQGKRTRELCDLVHEYAEEVITKRRAAIKSEDKEGSQTFMEGIVKGRKYFDFLDILLMARDEDGNGMSDLEIRNEVDTFMFEGHDTTTSSMSWTLYCLAQHPQHQDKIREEVRSVLKGRKWLEYEDLKNLNYTMCCIKEAMRLYPPVFLFSRKATMDFNLNTYVIPKDVNLLICPLIIHHNANIWYNPEEYDPLRFQPSNMQNHGAYDYIPFSAGSRNCIGQNFAMNEMKVVIGTIVNRLTLTVDTTHPVEMVIRVILRTKNDIKLMVEAL